MLRTGFVSTAFDHINCSRLSLRSLLRFLLSISSFPLRFFTWALSSSIPFGQYATTHSSYSDERPRMADRQSRLTAFQVSHSVEWLVLGSTLPSISENLQINFLPSQLMVLLAFPPAPTNKPQVIPVFSSRRLPAFSGRDFYTTTDSSATSHRFDPSRVSS